MKPVPVVLETFKCCCRNLLVLLMTKKPKNSLQDVQSSRGNDIAHKTFRLVEVLTHSSIYVSLLPFYVSIEANVALFCERSICPLCHGEYLRDRNQGFICFRKSDVFAYCM